MVTSEGKPWNAITCTVPFSWIVSLHWVAATVVPQREDVRSLSFFFCGPEVFFFRLIFFFSLPMHLSSEGRQVFQDSVQRLLE